MRFTQSQSLSAQLALSVNACRVWSALLVAIAFSSVGVAHAEEYPERPVISPSRSQDLARGQGVMDRARPEFDAMGIRLGSFMAYPAFETRVGYDDNVLAEDANTRDDVLFTLSPSLALESNWSRHFVSIAADSTSVLYTDETDEDNTQWGVAGEGRLDILESSDIGALISFQNRTEPRDAIDSIRVVDEPTKYDQFDVSGTWNYRS